MGLSIDRSSFSEADYAHAAIRLRQNLEALRQLLARPGFGAGPSTLGAELELSIIGPEAEALPLNREVLAAALDPHVQLELDRFNLEYNLTPVAPGGKPFTAMQEEMSRALAGLSAATGQFGGRVIAIGILPTLTMDQLQSGWMTDLPRYHALSAGIQRLRQESIHIRIDGKEPLQAEFDSVTVEGANTSFQLHLRIPPERFANCYNAAQLVTPAALAASANSPWLLGHNLWDETRIALFKQSVDTRRHHREWRRMARVPFGHGWVRKGAFELFAEACHLYRILVPIYSDADDVGIVAAGGTPALAELRLHQGTIWNWNRPVYDATDGGHLRIEFRALPAGPTPIDMVAGAAFLVGLTMGMSHRVEELLPAFPFRYADYNFYRGAQSSLRAQLLWPTLSGTSPREVGAADLCRELLPVADEGLDELGVDEEERRLLLGLIEDRVDSRMTPARWQIRAVRKMGDVPRDIALRNLVEEYLARAATGQPFTEWSC